MNRPAQALYDVVVLGAGPAGAACALALARAGVERVRLIDGPPPAGGAVGETLPPDTRLLLDRLGLWTAFVAEGHLPCLGSCSSWGAAALGFNDFLLSPHGGGWHLDRGRFDAFLRHHAAAAGVETSQGLRLVDADPDPSGGFALRLRGAGGDTIGVRARFVVDATGRASAFAKRLGARRRELDRLTFIYGYFDAGDAASASRLTLLEAVAQGWWYAAALPGQRLAVALAADADHVRDQGLGRDARWLGAALATRHLAPRLDGCRYLAGGLTPRVASSFILDRVAGPRWMAIGDAAAAFDPLAAQGLYKALADGLDAAASLGQALDGGDERFEDYAAGIQARFDAYLVGRNHFYGLERRWPGSAFWTRRQARLDLATAA